MSLFKAIVVVPVATGSVFVVAGGSAARAQSRELQKLTAADGAEIDAFGFSVAVSGDTAPGCQVDCTVTLTVDDSQATDTCSATVSIEDTTDPVLNGVPADATVECDAVPDPADVPRPMTVTPTRA